MIATKQSPLKPEDMGRLWTADDVAAYLQMSKSWVYDASARGELPSRSFANRLRFIPEEIRDWAIGKRPGGAQIVPLSAVGSKPQP